MSIWLTYHIIISHHCARHCYTLPDLKYLGLTYPPFHQLVKSSACHSLFVSSLFVFGQCTADSTNPLMLLFSTAIIITKKTTVISMTHPVIDSVQIHVSGKLDRTSVVESVSESTFSVPLSSSGAGPGPPGPLGPSPSGISPLGPSYTGG